MDTRMAANLESGDDLDWDELAADINQMYLQNDAANRVLQGIGWPPMKFLDADLWPLILYQVRDRRVEEAKADIEAVICMHYQGERLDAMMEEWISRRSTRGRRAILQEIIQTHKLGYHAVTVPTLFSQIEGLVAEHLAPNRYLNDKCWKKIVEVLTDTPSNYPGDRTARKFFIECVLREFRRPQTIPVGPSRHAILHGADVNYANEENSLKLILAFEYISRY